MSKEVLEISVMVDEQFDVNFNLTNGVLGLILSIFEDWFGIADFHFKFQADRLPATALSKFFSFYR